MSVGEAVRWTLPSLDDGVADHAPVKSDPEVPQPAAESKPARPVSAPTSVFDIEPAAADVAPDTVGAGGVTDPAEGRDVPGDTADAVDHAAALDAEREAARAAGHAEGFEVGRAEGHTAGLEQGREEALARVDADIAAVRELLAYLATPLEQLDDALEGELVTLSMAIARQLVRRELQTAPGEIVPVVREALAVLPSAQRDVTVSLHPEDAALVRGALSGNAEADAWRISEDPLLTRGGCRIAAGHSHVDATLESRLNAVAMSLSARSRDDD